MSFRSSQPLVFRTSRRVEFCHTDAAGLMHFSVYFLFMEQAEHEFLRHLGYSVLMEDSGQRISWPRVEARCQFRQAARFEDVLQIEVRVEHLGRSSVRYGFRFFGQQGLLAQGSLTTVCCRLEDSGPQSISIPESLREKLHQYLHAPESDETA